MTLAVGQTLQNRYRVISLLAQGGMGAVYRAWDARLNIPVALKEMLPQPGLDSRKLAQLRRQFQREAQTLAGLNHPHLVDVIDFFGQAGNAYLVMRLIDGESLAHRIERQGPLSEEQVLALADQLLEALDYCHSRDIIHRDVKPQNVIIRPDGQAILVDFGLVKMWDPRDPRTKTAMRGMGTPEYAPPEQYDLFGHTDARSDIYSLGATLYHALTGRAPPTATQRSASQEAFKPPRALNRSISPATEAAVVRAMELRVKNRFQSAHEMRAALSKAIKSSPAIRLLLGQGAASGLREKVLDVPRWAWGAAGVGVLGLVGLILGLLLWASGGKAAATPGSSLQDAATTAPPAVTEVAAQTATPAKLPPTGTSRATQTPSGTPASEPTSTSMGAAKPTLSPPVSPTPMPSRTPTATASATPMPSRTPTATALLEPSAAETSKPDGTEASPTPSPLPPPPTSGSGRIFYTIEAGSTYYLGATDPFRSQGEVVAPIAYGSSTCAGRANVTTLAGQSFDLYYGYRCGAGSPQECVSPDGEYKVTLWKEGGQYSMGIHRVADDSLVRALYQGPLNEQEPILWAPDSSLFYFTIKHTLHQASPFSAGYQPVIPTAYEPYLSPDGSMILYLQPVGTVGAYDIWVADADGSNARNVTSAPETYKTCARWGR